MTVGWFSRPDHRLEARRRRLVRVGGRVGRLLEDADLLRQDDVDRIARGDQEVETRRAVDLEGDRLLSGVELRGDVDAVPGRRCPTTSPLTWAPAGTAISAGWPWSCEGLVSAVPSDGTRGALPPPRTLSGVTGSARSMSSVATRTVSVVGSSSVARSPWSLVEKDDDSDEGEDGQQHADQDDEAIRSLHECSPLARVNENEDEVPAATGCDCGQQSTHARQVPTTRLVG